MKLIHFGITRPQVVDFSTLFFIQGIRVIEILYKWGGKVRVDKNKKHTFTLYRFRNPLPHCPTALYA
jgi:hypothetical protein